MSNNKFFFLAVIATFLSMSIIIFAANQRPADEKIISYIADPESQEITLYWKNDSNAIIGSIANLKTHIESKNRELAFAMNGGMFDADFCPQGLYIEKARTLKPLDKSSGDGNFYLEPNGVFYITTDNKAVICKTKDFADDGNIKYATQSGPMLVIDGKLHPAFTDGSKNIHIRNGVGILPDGKVVFAISEIRMNFYDFASYFKSLGCKNALYLDGFVSRAYIPEKGRLQTDGNLGVMIAVTSPLQ